MRTYYAIYIYYGTYDITWYAYCAWMWTALEADLGYTSAPMLKVFFRRYFNLPTNLNSKSGHPRKNYPGSPTGQSNKDSKKYKTDLVRMDSAKFNTHHHVTIEYRDEMMSHASDKSTRDLAALPSVRSLENQSSLRHTWAAERVSVQLSKIVVTIYSVIGASRAM
jgi:hypothetical protein